MAERFGGSFAPPLSDSTFVKYRKLIDTTPEKSELREALEACYVCCGAWWNTPESKGVGRQHQSGMGTIIDLDADIAAKLFDHIPWQAELEHYKQLFDGLTGELREAAYHMLWHAQELCLDREPITVDKL